MMLFPGGSGLAEERDRGPDLYCGLFPGDAPVHTFRPVDVRAKPEAGARTIIRLPAGHPVRVKPSKDMLKMHTSDGLRYQVCQGGWQQVEFRQAGKDFTGHVQGSDLALVNLRLPRADDTWLLVSTGGDARTSFEAVVVRGKQRLSSQAFELRMTNWGSYSGYRLEAKILGPKGFEPAAQVVSLRLVYEACGYDNPEKLLLWTGEKLVAGPAGDNQAEAGVFHVRSKFVFPSESGGEKNTVRVVTSIESFDGATSSYKLQETETKSFFWNGTVMQPRDPS